MKDVHAMAPTRGRYELRQVGITGIRKPIHVIRDGIDHVLSASFSVAVDLPAHRKGSDLSRNAELLAEIVDWTAQKPVESFEAACAKIAEELLVRHQYANDATVSAEAEFFLRKGIAPGRESFEDFTILAETRAHRGTDGQVTLIRGIGAEAVGMTACPCAMETCRERLTAEYPLLADPSLKGLPMITHNQRNRTRLLFELPPGVEVDATHLLEAIEHAQSSPTYAILKRGDEAQLVLNAHRNPKFVEDVMRDLLADLPARFPEIPDHVVVRVGTVSEESIHKYNVESSHETTFGELRRPSES